MTTLSKSLSLVSWHNVTIVLLFRPLPSVSYPTTPRFEIAEYPLIGVNFLGVTLFILLGLGNHKTLTKLPGAYLMSITGLLALLLAL